VFTTRQSTRSQRITDQAATCLLNDTSRVSFDAFLPRRRGRHPSGQSGCDVGHDPRDKASGAALVHHPNRCTYTSVSPIDSACPGDGITRFCPPIETALNALATKPHACRAVVCATLPPTAMAPIVHEELPIVTVSPTPYPSGPGAAPATMLVSAGCLCRVPRCIDFGRSPNATLRSPTGRRRARYRG